MIKILGISFLLLAAAAAVISIRAFKDRGFVFHNAYIFASEKEREAMDKAPCYRQSAVAFLMVSVLLLLLGAGLILSVNWLVYLAMVLAVALLIYVIISDKQFQKTC